MTLSTGIILYLILMNALGFVLLLISTQSRMGMNIDALDIAINVVSLIGGSVGVLLAIIVFDRKATKENMMVRVFAICVFLIEILLLVLLLRIRDNGLVFHPFQFLAKNWLIPVYLLLINIATLICFGIDKRNAITERRRIPIVTLLILSAVGGSIGGLIGMYGFRHKTQKDYFVIGLPMMLAVQVLLLLVIAA